MTMSATIGTMEGFDIPADEILTNHMGDCRTLFMMGINKEGDFFMDSTTSDHGQFLLHMAMAKRLIVDIAMGMEGGEDDE